jgi:hypothetical protein
MVELLKIYLDELQQDFHKLTNPSATEEHIVEQMNIEPSTSAPTSNPSNDTQTHKEDWTVVERRKRKKISFIDDRRDISSSDEEKSHKKKSLCVDLDLDEITDANIDGMQLGTITETNILYQSFAPKDQVLPRISNPPDSPKEILFTNKVTVDDDMMIEMLDCQEAIGTSKHEHCILTVKSKSMDSQPRSHMTLNVSFQKLSEELGRLPHGKYLVELLLPHNMKRGFATVLLRFSAWAKRRNIPYIITLPVDLANQHKGHLDTYYFVSVDRPFQEGQNIIPST